MDIKNMIGIGMVGLMSLGGSMFGLTLISGTAGAASSPTPTAEVTATAGLGSNVQSSSQFGDNSGAADSTEGISVEAMASEVSSSSESAAASDGPGGHQDPAGNVDNQSTTEQ